MVSQVARGWPAQFELIGPNRRCSIGFHFEQPVGIVADGDRQAVPVAELLLELLLPDPRAGAVAAAAIGQDQQLARRGERGLPLVDPPAGEQVDREPGRVGRLADVDRAPVVGQVVDAVGDRPPERVRPEVVHVDRLGLLAPHPPGVLELPDQLLLLGIDADLGQPGRAERLPLLGDVLELPIAVGMRRARLELLGVRVQPIPLARPGAAAPSAGSPDARPRPGPGSGAAG